jgi:hypothetical protein
MSNLFAGTRTDGNRNRLVIDGGAAGRTGRRARRRAFGKAVCAAAIALPLFAACGGTLFRGAPEPAPALRPAVADECARAVGDPPGTITADLLAGTSNFAFPGILEYRLRQQLPEGCEFRWRMMSASGVELDSITGKLVIGELVPGGTRFSTRLYVMDEVAAGRRDVGTFFGQADIGVVRAADYPLAGRWSQDGILSCAEPSVIAPPDAESRIRELVFQPNGSFSLTWSPFGSYRDFWGRYVVEADRIRLVVDGGNFVPPDLVPGGPYDLDGDRLTLRFWTGSPAGARLNGCGARFQRIAR